MWKPPEKEGLPMWTDTNRAKYNRDHLRYPSDLTDAEWAECPLGKSAVTQHPGGLRDSHALHLGPRWTFPADSEIEPLIPPAKKGGNKRTVDVRAVVNGLMYLLSTGCQWRYLPTDLPPRSTVHDYFTLWSWDGTLDRIHHALYVKCREKAEREASPTACIVDSQSVKSAEKGGP